MPTNCGFHVICGSKNCYLIIIKKFETNIYNFSLVIQCITLFKDATFHEIFSEPYEMTDEHGPTRRETYIVGHNSRDIIMHFF